MSAWISHWHWGGWHSRISMPISGHSKARWHSIAGIFEFIHPRRVQIHFCASIRIHIIRIFVILKCIQNMPNAQKSTVRWFMFHFGIPTIPAHNTLTSLSSRIVIIIFRRNAMRYESHFGDWWPTVILMGVFAFYPNLIKQNLKINGIFYYQIVIIKWIPLYFPFASSFPICVPSFLLCFRHWFYPKPFGAFQSQIVDG